MKIFDVIRLAFKNLFRSKVRTILTVLGIIIGTTAIIIMLSLGIAINKTVDEQMKMLGDATVITVYPNWDISYSSRRSRKNEWVEPTISKDELDKIAQIPNVVAVSPIYETTVKMEVGKYLGYVNLVGINPEAMEAFNYKVSEGRLLSAGDTNQVVFGFDIKSQLWDPKSRSRRRGWYYDVSNEEKDINFFEDKIRMTFDLSYGETIPGGSTRKPKLYKLEGVGILAEGDWETAYRVFMNIDELLKLQQDYNKSNNTDNIGNGGSSRSKKKEQEIGFQQARVKVDDIKKVMDVQEQIQAMGLNAYSMVEYLEQTKKTQAVMQGILGGIGAISLLVAAIGIANTMVMAIYERRKEIGIMKVIGARIKDIRRLFLYESSMIGFIGGACGVGVSYGVSYFLNTVGARFLTVNVGDMGGSKLSIIPAWLAVSGMVFSAFIGLVSGFLPARKATKLSALAAIHTE
ncbi:ABC transporter permease [Thermoclostridium stercorarium]|jgi:ABC-type antimicrobial peptide transport system permease subunit|uniref:ABC transporter permease n=1 Tax=Thermoclostridium stercorarium TaxID=1510 RepID=UPI0004B61BA5|nr:ABC transporter permease [Thermoclostridium stercorarium]UZQ86423.1 ABC transporter permease [Thermoclostridium stercorarium]